MSLGAPAEVSSPQKLSVVGAFKAAPTLVKILAADLYLTALWTLGSMAAVPLLAPFSFVGPDVVMAYLAIFFGLVFALVYFLMGRGIARGARGMWLLALVLHVLWVPFEVRSMLEPLTVTSILSLVFLVVALVLLLTPVVRRHCTKK